MQATDKNITPTLAGDLCELLRRLGASTGGNILKRLRAGVFSQQQVAGPSPSQSQDDALRAVPQPIQACALLLVASAAADKQPDELSHGTADEWQLFNACDNLREAFCPMLTRI